MTTRTITDPEPYGTLAQPQRARRFGMTSEQASANGIAERERRRGWPSVPSDEAVAHARHVKACRDAGGFRSRVMD